MYNKWGKKKKTNKSCKKEIKGDEFFKRTRRDIWLKNKTIKHNTNKNYFNEIIIHYSNNSNNNNNNNYKQNFNVMNKSNRKPFYVKPSNNLWWCLAEKFSKELLINEIIVDGVVGVGIQHHTRELINIETKLISFILW